MASESRIRSYVERLYGPARTDQVVGAIDRLVARYAAVPIAPPLPLTERSVVLITYGDQVRADERVPLEALGQFLREWGRDLIERVHILPFFPYSSDDGFSVIDYVHVDPQLGDWSHIEGIGRDFALVFDAVINHISSQSEWFRQRLAGDLDRQDFFVTLDPGVDHSRVTRPRALPLLSRYECKEGPAWFWTTFSRDQIDLNYAEPAVLLAMLDVLLLYVTRGATILRLDAIAYLWKRIGTSCIHLEETHIVVRLIRQVLDRVAPDALLLTETNVPHAENMSYFGTLDEPEGQIIYQFSGPPLIAHAIVSGSAVCLRRWASTLTAPGVNRTYLSFTASHDGVGVRPAEGLLEPQEIEKLAQAAESHGGHVSHRQVGGGKRPYELNISYVDLISPPSDTDELRARKFLLSQAIMLAMPGVPAIYFHSLVGSRSWTAGVSQTGQYRTINRRKLDLDELNDALDAPTGLRRQIYDGLCSLLRARRGEPAFDPYGAFHFPALGAPIFAIVRTVPDRPPVLALHNVGAAPVQIALDRAGLEHRGGDWVDVVSGARVAAGGDVTLPGYGFRWLRAASPKSHSDPPAGRSTVPAHHESDH